MNNKNKTIFPFMLLVLGCSINDGDEYNNNLPPLGTGGCGSLPTQPAVSGASCGGGDDDGGAEEEGGADTTAGDPPCEVTSEGVEYLCRGYVLGVYQLGTQQRVNFTNNNIRDNILCVDPEPGIALSADNAFYETENGHPNEYVELTICSPWHGMEDIVYWDWTDPATEEIATMLMETCQTACEEGNLNSQFPGSIEDATGTWSFVEYKCYFGSITGTQIDPAPPVDNFNPECVHQDAAAGYNPLEVEDYIPNVIHLPGPEPCDICNEGLACEDYDPSEHVSHSTSGGNTYAFLDWSWVSSIMNGDDLWTCDAGRLVFKIDPAGDEEFRGLGTSSFWYRLGVRTGDKNPKAWQYNPATGARIGSEYPLNTPENAAIAWAALSGETYVALTVTRSGRPYKIYITKVAT